MKKQLILFLFIPLFAFTVQKDTANFIGKWVGDDDVQIGYIIFDTEGFVSFEVEGQLFGGKDFEIKGKRGSMSYEINNDANPIEIDFVLTKLDTGEQRKMLCIARFSDDDTMDFASGFSEQRPTEFNSENTITFKRVK